MASSNSARNIRVLQNKLTETITKLSNYNIPCLVIFTTKKGVELAGTEAITHKMKTSMKCLCQCNCDAKDDSSWNECLKNAVIDMVQEENNTVEQTVLEPDNEELKKMVAPLPESTYEEAVAYLRYLIIREHKELGLPGTRIQYGKSSWRPINCWLNEVWDWSLVTCNFSNISALKYPGEGSITHFYKACIKKYLVYKGIEDHDNFYDTTMIDEKTLKRRRRFRGIHVEPTIVAGEQPLRQNATESIPRRRPLNIDDTVTEVETNSVSIPRIIPRRRPLNLDDDITEVETNTGCPKKK